MSPVADTVARMTATALDATQLEVVSLDGAADALVLGAPGTGKTTVAVAAVVDRVRERGWDPGDVLVLAASRRSAASLRVELSHRLGVATPGPVARTIASLAHGIVAGAAAATGAAPPVYVSGADHDRLIAAILEEEIERDEDAYWPTEIGRSTRRLAAFRTELRDLFARAVERGIRAAELARLGRDHARPAWVAAAAFMPKLAARIEEEFRGLTPLDSTYVLRRAADLAEAGDASVPRYRLLVIDDAQELGRGGLRLVRALARQGARVIALGDPDVATGGFRGAVPGGFASALWSEIGREPVRIALPTVHRHGTAIRSVVERAVAAVGTQGGAVAQRRATPAEEREGEAIAVVVPDEGALVAFVARRLRERAVKGVPWSELAVVVRSGASVPRLARELRTLEVPAVGAGAAEVRRDSWAVRSLIEVARAATEHLGDAIALTPEHAEEILTGSVGRLDALSFRRLRTALKREALAVDPHDDRRAGALVAEALAAPGGFASLAGPEARAAQRAARVLHAARADAAAGKSIEEILWTIWSGSGLERVWGEQSRGAGLIADEANRHLDAVIALFAAAKRFTERAPRASAVRFIEAWLAAEVEEDSLALADRGGSVLVGTPQTLLGAELDTVVLADLQDGVWPNPRIRGSFLGTRDLADLVDGVDLDTLDRRREVLHDEIRFFAAAVGRARRDLVAIAIDGEEEAPSALMRLVQAEPHAIGQDDDAVAPLTLRGLVGGTRRELARTGDRAAAAVLARLAAEGVPGADPSEWFGLATETTTAPLVEDGEPVEVHPSSLGRYLECPLHWALGRLGADTSTAASSLGTIVHDVADDVARGELEPEPEAVLERVLGRWSELEFESDWLEDKERARARAIAERLARYQRELVDHGGGTIASETRLRLEIGRAILRGRIDRVERVIEDGETRAVVVDFKTGKESRNQTARQLEENAQLAAYQLALAAGAIEGAESIEDAAPGGARLVILTPLKGQSAGQYAVRSQPVLDAPRAEAWRSRIAEAAEGMARPTFLAYVDSHCDAWGGGGLCPIHVVEAVTA